MYHGMEDGLRRPLLMDCAARSTHADWNQTQPKLATAFGFRDRMRFAYTLVLWPLISAAS
jgi:hypothetical protein